MSSGQEYFSQQLLSQNILLEQRIQQQLNSALEQQTNNFMRSGTHSEFGNKDDIVLGLNN